MDGIVAAGALAPPALRELGIERIPLLRVDGHTILHRVCACLLDGGKCNRVHVLAPEEVPLPALPGVVRAPYSSSIVSAVLNCAAGLEGGGALLLGSGDIPLLTSAAVAAVAELGASTGADVVYPVAERAVVEQRFPGSKRTYVKLRGQTVTGGNLFYLDAAWLLRQRELLERLFALRKSPLGLARLFGWGFVLRLLTGQLGLAAVELHLSALLDGKLRAAVLPYAELAADLDKLADLETFRPYLDPDCLPTAG